MRAPRQESHLRSRCKIERYATTGGPAGAARTMRKSEDSMGARRMPWRRKPMKGAASRDSPGGGAHGL